MYNSMMQVGTTGGEASTGRDLGVVQGGMTCDEHDLQRQQQHHHVTQQNPHHQHQMAGAAFHVSRPTHPVSNLISPHHPSHPLQHTSIMLDEDSYHVSRIMDNFQVIIFPTFLFGRLIYFNH